MRRILAGEQSGALSDMVALNAGAALYVMDRAVRFTRRGRAGSRDADGQAKHWQLSTPWLPSRNRSRSLSSTERLRARGPRQVKSGCESYGRREISRSDYERDPPESSGGEGAGLAGDPAGTGGEGSTTSPFRRCPPPLGTGTGPIDRRGETSFTFQGPAGGRPGSSGPGAGLCRRRSGRHQRPDRASIFSWVCRTTWRPCGPP